MAIIFSKISKNYIILFKKWQITLSLLKSLDEVIPQKTIGDQISAV